MADDALLERIDAHLAREVTLHDIMHMDHAELRAWQQAGLEGMREMSEWIRQMAAEFTNEMRESRREFVRESAERRRETEDSRREWSEELREWREEWREELRAHREALWKIIDRLDEGGSGAS